MPSLALADAIERDLKRFDEITGSFERTALALGFVNLFIALWARAPGLQINLGSIVGIPTVGFNVGYAIVYGPLVAAMTLAAYASALQRRGAIKAGIQSMVDAGRPADLLSAGDRLALSNFGNTRSTGIGGVADFGWRTLWYFAIPALAAIVALRRYCDFVPNEAAKSWTVWERVGFLFLNGGGWEIRPILPARPLEGPSNLMAELPYIYAPVQSWIELALVLLCCWLAWYAWRRYFDD